MAQDFGVDQATVSRWERGRREPRRAVKKAYDRAVTCLIEDRAALLAFYDVPAAHWKHIRSSNPIESTFATVRLRADKTKGCLSRETALAMVFTLAKPVERHWRRLNGANRLGQLIEGIRFRDGEAVQDTEGQAAA